jgi:AraC-like DNA-binding protein
MLFRSYAPRAPLSEFVADFWLYENYRGDHPRELILPSGTFEIVFNLREDELRIYGPAPRDRCRRFTGALISGPYAGSFMSDTAEEAAIMGVHFKPGGAYPVFGMPAGELANTHIDLRTVWGPAASELRNRLWALTDPVQRFEQLEHAITTRLSDAPTRRGAVRCALGVFARTRGQARVSDVANALDLSQRRFVEVFTAEVGLTPKLFSRIQRFQHTVALPLSAPKPDWAQVAAACGYFDQSHLIRDFVEFCGMGPSEYWERHSQLERSGAHVKRHHLPLAG